MAPHPSRPHSPALLCASLALLGLHGAVGQGLLAEYFTPLTATCAANGSEGVLDGLLPTITRRDALVNFPERKAFPVKRCAWETIGGQLSFNCRGTDELLKNFAARWTGYLAVLRRGEYTFEIHADDGARLTMGYGLCPGINCGDRQTLLNTKWDDLRPTESEPDTYAKQCSQCEQGIYVDCWVSNQGCEPFSLWRLEADRGCRTGGLNITRGTRYLAGGAHPLELLYFQRGGPASITLYYRGPDTEGLLVAVPEANLIFPTAQALRAEWYSLPRTPQPTRLPVSGAVPEGAQLISREDDIFVNNGPDEGIFSTRVELMEVPVFVRWFGTLTLPFGGAYTFRLESDDGSRVVLGGRGGVRERVLVDNNGLWDGTRTVSAFADMLPGTHPIRIEYFHVPGASLGPSSVPRPPGLQLSYIGPHTFAQFERLRTDMLELADADCQLSNFDWTEGMSTTRSCTGECFDGEESVIGDRICDDGRTSVLGPTQALTCDAYNWDNGDCVIRPNPQPVPVRPDYRCHVSCPPGNFRRRDCSVCDQARTSQNGGMCSQAGSANLSFVRCCVARLQGTEYWGRDCIAFGTLTACNETLLQIVEAMNQAPTSLEWRSERPGAQLQVKGETLVDCEGDHCNEITSAFVLNPFTLEPTEQRVCPIQESAYPGIECYVGPWEVTLLQDPSTQCQDGEYKWNFCRDRKTLDGRPFVRCCSFLYINSLQQGECRFTGLSEGTCAGYIELLRDELRSNRFLSISSPIVLHQCEGDLCNDPSNPDLGCPEKVIEEHPFTLEDRLNGPIDWSDVVGRSPQNLPTEVNWALIFIPLSGVIFLCITALVYRKATQKEKENPFHSKSAKVVSKDTFVEPTKDLDYDDAPSFGVVKKRPLALREMVEETKFMKPQVLRLEQRMAAQEAVIAAESNTQVTELALVKPFSPQTHSPLHDGQPDHAEFLNAQLYDDEDIDSQPVEDSLELERPRPVQLELPGQLPQDCVHVPATTTALVLREAPEQLQEGLRQVVAPPEAVLPITTMAATLTVQPQLSPALGPLGGGARGRPPAAARMMRQGLSGPPRVAL